jgi:hypothetical protein
VADIVIAAATERHTKKIMTPAASRILGCITALVLTGCTVYEATEQTHFARQYMTNDLETQIMFNLIRAMHGLPFEHYDVQQLESVVTASLTPSGGVGRTTVTNGFNPLVVVSSAIQTITRSYTFNISANRQSVVTAVINPVNDNPEVYAAYARFLNYDPNQKQNQWGLRIVRFGEEVKTIKFRPTRPTPDENYIKETLTYWEGNYYWIPSEYIAEFTQLWLSLVGRKAAAGASDKGLKALNLGNANGTIRTFAPLGPQ